MRCRWSCESAVCESFFRNVKWAWCSAREIYEASREEVEQVRAVHPALMRHVGPPCVVRNGRVAPRCTEGTHFCGVPVWRSYPDIERRI